MVSFFSEQAIECFYLQDVSPSVTDFILKQEGVTPKQFMHIIQHNLTYLTTGTLLTGHTLYFVLELDEVIAKGGNILLTQLEIKSF